MRLSAWQIVREKYAPTALSGEGARRYGGRFNSKGTAMVYTSSSISLAMLESLVHMDRAQFNDTYVAFRITFAAGLTKTLALEALPPDWFTPAGMPGAQRLGDAWVQSAASVVLRVPSVVLPNPAFDSEHNFIINPAHDRFSEIEVGEQIPLSLDGRLRA